MPTKAKPTSRLASEIARVVSGRLPIVLPQDHSLPMQAVTIKEPAENIDVGDQLSIGKPDAAAEERDVLEAANLIGIDRSLEREPEAVGNDQFVGCGELRRPLSRAECRDNPSRGIGYDSFAEHELVAQHEVGRGIGMRPQFESSNGLV